jgi:hypothetical protein
MKVTADTNVLVRAAVRDDLSQSRRAAKILADADLVAVPVPVLCDLCGCFVVATREPRPIFPTQFVG